MLISWKTNGSADAVDTMRGRLENNDFTDYITWASVNGRVNFKYEMVGDDLVISEEWNCDRAAYDALNIDQTDGEGNALPMVETTDHLSFD
jgi:hypothetical protein